MIPRLCYISDGARGTAGRPLADVVRCAVAGGVGLVVLRELELEGDELGRLVESLLPLRAQGARLVVSRRLDVARAYQLDGVHLAVDATPVPEARAWLGADALIGYSAHSGEEARRVASEGASYVTLSPIYATESKPGAQGRGVAWLAKAIQGLPIPALALGGITASRAGEVLAAGAWGIAAVSSIGGVPDVEAAARELASVVEGARS